LTYIIICLFFYAGVFVFDMIPLIKKKDGKVILIYLPIYLFTLAVNVLYGLGFDIPSPADPIKNLVSSIFGLKQG
jgi:uncharacterized membrane protein